MNTDLILSVVMGLSLAAACGFRVFVPLLALSIVSKAGMFNLDPSLAWIGTTPALLCFSIATVAEIVAYKVPWVDNALDSIATPAAVIAGTLVAASQFGAIAPGNGMLKWGASIIAGGGLAGVIQLGTVALRTLSLGLTGGLGNPIFGAAESGTSVVVSILAVLVPLVAGLIVLALIVAMLAIVLHLRERRRLRVAVRG